MALTIDQLAAAAGTSTRTIRAFQTQGLLAHPELRGRTGIYGPGHLERLRSISRLQAQGFSLQSLAVLFGAHDRGETLDDVLGPAGAGHTRGGEGPSDSAELYGFSELQSASGARRRSGRAGRPLLSVVPTTLLDQTQAS